jgi:hypothetical protein
MEDRAMFTNWLRGAQAPRWHFWLARVFGRCVSTYNDGTDHKLYKWRGRIYVI